MLYYLMLVPAVLSTAVIYFLSPALSYWWLLPVLLGCFVAANLVYVLLMFVCSLFAGPNRMYDRISPFYLALTLALDGWILALCRIKIHVEGLEKVPTDSEFLFVSNHRSNFDPMVQWWVLRRWPLAFVSKPSNMRKFVIGPFVRRCCFLPIDRENARNAMRTIHRATDFVKNDITSIGIYPEGTRSKTGELLEFKDGVFYIAKKAPCPVAVITVKGTENLSKNLPFKSTKVLINVLGVIEPEEFADLSTHELGEKVREMMLADLGK